MNDSRPQRWYRAALLAGALYLAVGLVSATLAGEAASSSAQFVWRLSAFLVSGVVLVVHAGYERLRLHNTTVRSAWHAAVGVALGGFGLALAANIHDLRSAAGYRPRMLVALPAWPLLTAVPAFLVAWIVAAVLGRRRA